MLESNVLFFVFQINFIDEVESNLVSSLLDYVFKKTMALHMIREIEAMIANNCQGCNTSHLSQSHHSCLFDTVHEQAPIYWDEAMRNLNQGAVIFEFYTRCEARTFTNGRIFNG